MADISEAEAILHLKRALGEIEAGDAVPAPLPPVAKPAPPPAKVQKTSQQQMPMRGETLPAPTPVQPSIGPTPRNEIRQPSHVQQPPRQQQGMPQRPQMRPPGQPGFMPQMMDGGKGASGPGFMGPAGVGAKAPAMPGMSMPPPNFQGGSAQQSRQGGPAGSQAAAAAAAASASGKNKKQFEIPQKKVGAVIGKGSATLNAIKAYSKAQCFIEQHSPDEEKATVYMVGTDKEILKCKQTTKAIIDGSMSISTLFTLAGVPMPRGGVEDFPTMSSAPSIPQMDPTWGGMPSMPTGPMGTMGPGMMLPGMAPPPGAGSAGSGGPNHESSQMQRNLDDYYARWWSTYAAGGGGEAEGGNDESGGGAFDKEALAKLADRAAKGLPAEEPPAPAPPMMESPPPGPPPEVAGGICECGEPFGPNAKFCSNCGNKLSKPAPPEMPPMPEGALPPPGQPLPPPQATQLPRGPITLKGFLRPTDVAKPKKDDDALQNMMERLQGNVTQTKQAMDISAMAPTRPPPPPPRGPGMGMLGGEDDPRTRADYEFEALIGRMQAAQAPEEVEPVARETLIRFPAFTPPQVVDLLTKINGMPAIQNFQGGELLAELCRMCPTRLKELTCGQFTSLTSTLAAWTRRPDIPKSPRFKDLSKLFFLAASNDMSTRLMAYAPHELNCCLAAFVSVGFSDHKFFASVARAALARHSSFAPVQLTALLAILSEMRLMQTDLFNNAAAFLTARAKELRPVDISRVLRSFAKCGIHHGGLCKAVGDEVCTRYRDKTAVFKAEDLVEIGWALCALQHYHEGVFRLMFKALEKSETIASDSLLQLYELHLALETEHKDAYSNYRPETHLIEALEDHYKDNRKDERRCSEKHRNDVASALKSLVEGSVHVNHRTSLALLVDVVALRKRSSSDGFVHVDLDSNVTQVRSLDQDDPAQASVVTEGFVALRRRILQKSGLRLVTVKESEWRDLDDSKEKRRHLRGLLTNLGDVLQ